MKKKSAKTDKTKTPAPNPAAAELKAAVDHVKAAQQEFQKALLASRSVRDVIKVARLWRMEAKRQFGPDLARFRDLVESEGRELAKLRDQFQDEMKKLRRYVENPRKEIQKLFIRSNIRSRERRAKVSAREVEKRAKRRTSSDEETQKQGSRATRAAKPGVAASGPKR